MKDLENKKQSHKATMEKLKKAKKSFKALKKELNGLDAKEYETNMEVVLIQEKAAAVERIAASWQAFKDNSKAKDYQHRKAATIGKVNGMILARRAGVGSTGFQVQLLEANQHAPSLPYAYPYSDATQPYSWRDHCSGGSYNDVLAHGGNNDDGASCNRSAYSNELSCGGGYNDGLVCGSSGCDDRRTNRVTGT